MILHSVDHLTLPRAGEQVCGDAVVVRRDEERPDRALIAVVDALGHGARAAEAAALAIDVLGRASLDADVLSIIDDLDRGLRGSRGACALVCLLRAGKLEGCSIGNVELRSSGMRLPFLLTPGVLGTRVRKPRLFVGTIPAPSPPRVGGRRQPRLVAYSDGVSSRFQLDTFAELSTGEAARAIFERHRRDHDDASLLVADIQVPAQPAT